MSMFCFDYRGYFFLAHMSFRGWTHQKRERSRKLRKVLAEPLWRSTSLALRISSRISLTSRSFRRMPCWFLGQKSHNIDGFLWWSVEACQRLLWWYYLKIRELHLVKCIFIDYIYWVSRVDQWFCYLRVSEHYFYEQCIIVRPIQVLCLLFYKFYECVIVYLLASVDTNFTRLPCPLIAPT